MTEREDLIARFDQDRHDLLNMLQGIVLHTETGLDASKKCDLLSHMEPHSCFQNLDVVCDNAKVMCEMSSKYLKLACEMRKLAHMYFQRYPVQPPQ
jgi:hypothetical protein